MATTKRFVAKNGLDNNTQSLTNVGILGSTLTMSAAHSLTFTTTGTSTLTVPSGTATLVSSGGALGTPTSGTLTSCTGLPIAGITGLGTGVATALGATVTGSGGIVLETSPSLTTPTLGVASATSVNKVSITTPATSATLTIADGKTLTANNTLTLTGTDSSSVAFGTGGTVAYTGNKLSAFASTSSSELAGVLSDETGTGALVFSASPTFTGTVNAANLTLSGDLVATTSNVQFNSIGVNTAASGTAGEIRATNEITSFFSDARLKNFHGTIEKAGEKVAALNGYYFTENEVAKSLGYNNDKMQVGVSAQEVEAVLPHAVVPAPIDDKYLTVKYEKLVPLLIEAIKELQVEVAELKKNR
jgi:hypothetical protein